MFDDRTYLIQILNVFLLVTYLIIDFGYFNKKPNYGAPFHLVVFLNLIILYSVINMVTAFSFELVSPENIDIMILKTQEMMKLVYALMAYRGSFVGFSLGLYTYNKCKGD
ncbi:MAG: hypothetical protein RSD90_06840 [Anaerovoracaceae bacterium]